MKQRGSAVRYRGTMPPAAAVTLQIHTFRAGTDAPLKDLPSRLLVAKWGDTPSGRGVVRVNDRTLALLPANQALRKFDRVALDFQHNTLTGKEPVKVAGYGIPRVVRGEGVWMEDIEYTPEGKDVLPGGHYPDISPAVERDPDGTVIFLHSAGAVRQGELDGLVFPFAALAPLPPESPKPTTMQSPALTALIALLAAIGVDALPEDPSAEQITAATTAATAKLASLKPAEPDADDAAKKPDAFSAELASLKQRQDKLEQDATQHQIDSLLSAATNAGKVVPFSAAVAYRFTPDELKAELDKLPAGKVPGVGKADIEAFNAGKPDDAEGVQIFAAMGLTEEDYKAATKA